MMDRVVISLLTLVFALFTAFMSSAQALTLKEIMNTPKEKAATVKVVQSAKKDAVPGGVVQQGRSLISEPFSNKVVEQKIQKEVQGQYGDNIEVRFAPWLLPGGKTSAVSQFIVEEIEVNKQRTKVAALVHFQIGGQLKTLKIRGRLEQLIEVPVLNRPVHYGEVIAKEDITWTKISGRKSTRLLITSADDLIGRQPKSGFLKVDMPLYQRDVEYVRDVEKGAIVTAHYKTAKLELITKVRALEHGHKGASIRVLNPDTNKILYGVVTGPSTISLAP